MRKLGKGFLVSPTPEQFTSKTCCGCFHPGGPNEDCKLPQNRDSTGASNIGLQFMRLLTGRGPIRSMTAEDLEFLHSHDLCLRCDED